MATARKDRFSADERRAMAERSRELRASGAKADLEREALDQIATMAPSDRVLAERVHAIVKEVAPALSARTWYGMPAYAREGQVVCFFQAAGKFKARYATLGFSDKARLDEGSMWPTAFAIREISPEVERRIAELLRNALG